MTIADPISAVGGASALTANAQTAGTEATDAFGLSFEALLKIVLTQLTYQDPLKPMDNFQFVSQLAQFSQIQQSQDMVDSLATLVRAQTTGQAAGLLGKVVDVAAGPATVSGTVVAVSFASGNPTITIETEEGSTISNLVLGNVIQIREGE
jgi:flagellar basal-body rod modification protein FlgD